MVKEKEICIEACPISNLSLAYTTDLRTHPTRALMHAGLDISISSDDPCFLGYDGTTLDYAYVWIAWDLDIADLKKFCLVSLKHASITEEEKKELRSFFDYKWQRFLDQVV